MARFTVEKIGGTSMSRFGEVLANIILRKGEPVFNRLYIVSAYAGVTNALLEDKKTGAPGVFAWFASGDSSYREHLLRVREQLESHNRRLQPLGLVLSVADEFVRGRISAAQTFLENIEELLATGYVAKRELLLSAREYLAAIGEAHSAFNSVNILQSQGYPSRLIDLSGGHDGRELTIDERIADALKEAKPAEEICVITGYAKGVEGIMRHFDRGYSEVTFSKVAVQLGAAEAIIHKEYHLSSADPVLVGGDRVRPVGHTNFDVADQLADIGMEAIHPKASKPLELAKIPIRVKNAFEPSHPGTIITRDYVAKDPAAQVVAGTSKVIAIEVHDTEMIGEAGFDKRLMEAIAPEGVSYISKSTNANTISFVVLEKDVTESFKKRLGNFDAQVKFLPAAIVSVIGANLGRGRVLTQAAEALAESGITILAVSQATRPVNIQFVIERERYADAVKAIHRACCE